MPEFGVAGVLDNVVKITDRGTSLSVKLCSSGRVIKTANESLQGLSSDVSLTCCILKELGQTLEEDDKTKLCSQQAFSTVKDILHECHSVFERIENTIEDQNQAPEHESIGRRANASYCTDLEMFKVKLEILKSTTLLVLNVIIYARQVRHRAAGSELKHQRALIQSFLEEKSEKEARAQAIDMAAQAVQIPVDQSRCEPSTSTDLRHLGTEISANAMGSYARRKVARLLDMANSRLPTKAHNHFGDSGFHHRGMKEFPEIPCHEMRPKGLPEIYHRQSPHSRSQMPRIVESNDPNISGGGGNSGALHSPPPHLCLQGSPASTSVNPDSKTSALRASLDVLNNPKSGMLTTSTLTIIETTNWTPDQLVLQWTNLTPEEMPFK